MDASRKVLIQPFCDLRPLNLKSYVITFESMNSQSYMRTFASINFQSYVITFESMKGLIVENIKKSGMKVGLCMNS